MTRHTTTMMAAFALAAATLQGCAAVRGIFRLGVWSGVIVAVIAIALVGGAVAMFRK